jgi:hypothetical protein
MHVLGVVILVLLMLATAGVLVTGIVLMARGGAANQKYGNKLMVARVALQGAALAMVVLLLMTRNG